MSLSAIADAANAISRLYGVFEAELLDDTHIVDPDLEMAIEVKGASFTWDAPPPEEESSKKKKKSTRSKKSKPASGPLGRGTDEAADIDANAAEDRIFKVQDLDLAIPRGKLVAIVGPVGSGKTSLLQGIIGEMRKTSGTITFGGSVGYCAQSAWIQVCFQVVNSADEFALIARVSRMPPFERIFVSAGLSTRRGIGRLFRILVSSQIWTCFRMVI